MESDPKKKHKKKNKSKRRRRRWWWKKKKKSSFFLSSFGLFCPPVEQIKRIPQPDPSRFFLCLFSPFSAGRREKKNKKKPQKKSSGHGVDRFPVLRLWVWVEIFFFNLFFFSFVSSTVTGPKPLILMRRNGGSLSRLVDRVQPCNRCRHAISSR